MRRSPLKCDICDTEFNELFNLNKHTRNIHGVKILKCDICSYTTNDPLNYQRHKEGCIKRKRNEEEHEQDRKRAKVDEPLVYSCKQGPLEDDAADEHQSCFDGTLSSRIWNNRGTHDILIALQKYKERMRNATWTKLKKHKGIQFHFIVQATLFKIQQDGNVEKRQPHFCGKNR